MQSGKSSEAILRVTRPLVGLRAGTGPSRSFIAAKHWPETKSDGIRQPPRIWSARRAPKIKTPAKGPDDRSCHSRSGFLYF